MSRTWEDNAAEFAALDEGEGWPFARLVACSVEKGVGGRGNTGVSRTRNSGKVSANEFATVACTSADRVLRYLEGWQTATKKRLVKGASTLTPNDTDTPIPTDPQYSWLDEDKSLRYVETKTRPTGGRPRDAQPEAAVTIIERRGPEAVVEKMTPQQRRDMQAALQQQTHQDFDDTVRDLGGTEPDLGPEPFPSDLAAEADRIGARIAACATDIEALMGRAEPDQRPEIVAIMDPRMIRLTRALYGEVTVS